MRRRRASWERYMGCLDRFDRESPPAKVLIFSASTQTLDILEGTFKTVYPNSVRIDGATAACSKTEKRRQI